MFCCTENDDLSFIETVLVNQGKELCGIVGGQSNASMRRGSAHPRRDGGAVKGRPAHKDDITQRTNYQFHK